MDESGKVLLGPWPVLKAATETACDGRNPRTDAECRLGQHAGYHEDAAGDRWLDDGDLARPDWIHDPRD